MKRILLVILFLLVAPAVVAQVRVTPSSVNAYSQGATTVYLTFSNVIDRQPADACWCGDIIPADPDIGFKCDPASVFGCLPVRYDRSRLKPNGVYTDIMSIPPSVARRAYADAASGAEATFFYVRRFVSTRGGPDEFVPVTIRLSGNGAAVSFSITDVKLSWGTNKPVMLIRSDEKLPTIKAEIKYTGTGRLRGRWEIVKPGEELPSSFDLLTEATIPPEERARQKRYTLLSRFNIFLPPTGKFTLPGPELWKMPNHTEGLYLVLLRIEAAEDAQRNSTISTGGVAGFPLPVLRYLVGSGTGRIADATLTAIAPDDDALIASGEVAEFRWKEIEGAAMYRVEIEDESNNSILSAVTLAGTYRAPSWLKEKTGALQWRVIALDSNGNPIGETPRRRLRLAK
ncbi:MAG: hypothetical protein AB1631_07880 [Acidobacteriota bacterium]